MNRTDRETKQKRYWQSLEEKQGQKSSDWSRPEFPENIEEIRQADRGHFSRRNFLKLMGAGAVMAGAACRRPTEQIVPAVIQPVENTPGLPSFYSSVTPEGIGLIIRTREGRPVHLSGNADHPLSGGGISASDGAAIMDLYDPDRLRRAVKLNGGRKQSATEAEVLSEARGKLREGGYVLISGPLNGPSSRALVGEFMRAFPGGRLVELRADPTLRQIAAGQRECYGDDLIPYYRFDRADLIVSIDGDFLGTMLLPAVFTRDYTSGRDVRRRGGRFNRLVAFESMYTVTGSNADERFAIRPGDQALLALCLAAQIAVVSGRGAVAGKARSILENYTPAKVAAALNHGEGLYEKGSFEKNIERIAGELWDARGRSLVVGGSPLAANGANAAGQIAINLLNSLLENDGKTVDYGTPILQSPGISDSELQSLAADMAAGKIRSVVLAGSNPFYHAPAGIDMKKALGGVAYKLSIVDRLQESALLGNAALPLSHFLEAWSDAEPVKGILSVQQPAIRPLYQTRCLEDWLIQLAGGELGGAKSFHDYIKARWQGFARGGFTRFWNSVLQNGYYAPGRAALRATRAARNFRGEAAEKLPASPSSLAQTLEGTRLILGLYYGVQVGDGSLANNAYRQELPDPVTKIVWDNFVAVLPATARRLGWKQDDLLTVKTDGGALQLPLHLQPGLHPQSALVALGYGRSAAGKIADNVGQNALGLSVRGPDSFAFSGMVAQLSATGDQYHLASTQTIYRNGFNDQEKNPLTPQGVLNVPYSGSGQLDRPILRETTRKEYASGQFKLRPEALYYPTASLMPEWNYKDVRWHMAVDLNQCTGCGACVTSCNIENNIPMVGHDQVRRGREMHWMRIDRYFSGEEANPDVAHQPMLCQHCENAPCENVCPVAATQHNNEGLNVMAYNRCVGTRYCANNCPYKVRRFNWHENWNYWEGFRRSAADGAVGGATSGASFSQFWGGNRGEIRDPQHLGLNPDVTVRTRGVIEKCTFCIQRIAAARQEAHARGEKNITDGTVITACQEVCPSGAITFGNILDEESRVKKLVEREKGKRGYQVLDYLLVKPSVTYLAKIRNRNESA
ncbi:MAG: TAT-variant-translocated molybdopterin oxidoreductase [Leptospirales bacterium]|nr:TAT-variant-translocated molybdopterin oxidoreductase [Leptospirales bacterium]